MKLAKQLSKYDTLTVHCNSSGERRAGAIDTQCSTRDDEIHHDQSVQFAGQHASFELCVEEMCRRVKKADITLNNEFFGKEDSHPCEKPGHFSTAAPQQQRPQKMAMIADELLLSCSRQNNLPQHCLKCWWTSMKGKRVENEHHRKQARNTPDDRNWLQHVIGATFDKHTDNMEEGKWDAGKKMHPSMEQVEHSKITHRTVSHSSKCSLDDA